MANACAVIDALGVGSYTFQPFDNTGHPIELVTWAITHLDGLPYATPQPVWATVTPGVGTVTEPVSGTFRYTLPVTLEVDIETAFPYADRDRVWTFELTVGRVDCGNTFNTTCRTYLKLPAFCGVAQVTEPIYPPLNLQIDCISNEQVDLTWDEPAFIPEDFAGYQIKIADSEAGPFSDTGGVTTELFGTVLALMPGDLLSKYYAVVAVDVDGNESALSNVVNCEATPSTVDLLFWSAPHTMTDANGTQLAALPNHAFGDNLDDAVAVGAANRPALKHDEFGAGVHSVGYTTENPSHEGTTDAISIDPAILPGAGTSPSNTKAYSIFLVFKSVDVSSTNVLFRHQILGSSQGLQAHFTNPGVLIVNSQAASGGVVCNDGNLHLLEIHSQGNAELAHVLLDGAIVIDNAAGMYWHDASTTELFWLGATVSGGLPANAAAMDQGDFLLYVDNVNGGAGMDLATRQQNYAYINGIYGTAWTPAAL